MERKERLLYRIKEGIFDVGYIWSKETASVLKDEGVLIFFILVPLIYPILYAWCYNNEVTRDVPVAVVDQSRSQLSREFTRGVDASPDVSIKYYCNDMEEAKRLVGKQEVYGILFIPSDFSTRRSFSLLIVSPYTNLVARQAKDGLFHVGRPSCPESSLISDLESPASLSGLMTPSSATALSPGL